LPDEAGCHLQGQNRTRKGGNVKQFIPFRVNWPGVVVVILAILLLGFLVGRSIYLLYVYEKKCTDAGFYGARLERDMTIHCNRLPVPEDVEP
jgi:hypothetical protein